MIFNTTPCSIPKYIFFSIQRFDLLLSKCCNIDVKGSKALVQRHAVSKKHKKNAASAGNCRVATIENMMSPSSIIREIEVGKCMYFIEHDNNLNSSNDLTALFKSVYRKLHSDSLKLRSLICNLEKAAKIVQNVIGFEGQRRIVDKAKTSIFSL